MKSDDSYHELGEILRSQKPGAPPQPALEARILTTLRQRGHRRPSPRWWPWLLPPPALAAMMLWAWHQPAAPVPELSAQPVPDPGSRSVAQVASLVTAENPLQAETRALTRDAARVGSFLIDCLPSIDPTPE